jgi:putative DNA primase/helicase
MPPDIVKIATQSYQEDEDVLGHFIDDSCFLGTDKKVKAIDFYNAYTKWCEENGHEAMNSTNFGRRMSLRFENERGRSGKYYFGVGLSQDPPWM